ncbi:MAG: class I SAM-dependent methyltransferase [Thermotogae bacterium]|nr:class I SAM-dependent methyltransferase [Thermotogota bacterium]
MNNKESLFYKKIKNISVNQTDSSVLYNNMESQSGKSLAGIYKTFDPNDKFHWNDIGRAIDFLVSTDSYDKKVLDFGPGDGWPSLIIAPYVKEIHGIDSSEKRINECKKNALRLNIKNSYFETYKTDSKLPYEDNFFDSVVASSSIEQTPDCDFIMKELLRILKPGGKMRIFYESLERYDNEYDLWIESTGKESCFAVVYLRNITEEYCKHYYLYLNISYESLKIKLNNKENFESFTDNFESFEKYIEKAEYFFTESPLSKNMDKEITKCRF